jgi:hypothetical protein
MAAATLKQANTNATAKRSKERDRNNEHYIDR